MDANLHHPGDAPPSPAQRPAGEAGARDMRKAPRRRALLGGKLVFEGGACSLDCTIRDLSQTGARVRLGGGLITSPEVWMIDLRAGVAYAARVLWRRGQEAGLGFTAAHGLDQPATPELAAMRRLWVEHLAR